MRLSIIAGATRILCGGTRPEEGLNNRHKRVDADNPRVVEIERDYHHAFEEV